MTKQEFKSCFDEYFDAIRNYLYYRSGDAEMATDIAQDVFMKLWEKRMHFDQRATKSLLYKIASDMFISQIRKKQVADNYLSSIRFDEKADSPEESLQYKELQQRYEKALTQLSEKQRVVFLMSRMEDLTYKEIAVRLGLSVKAIEKRMSKTLSILKTIIYAAQGQS